MKHIKHWLITIAVLLCSITSSAHDFEVGGVYYKIFSSSDFTVEVTFRGTYFEQYSDEYGGAVIIPSTVTYNGETYEVAEIGSCAFYGCSSLTSITLPESVTSIGSSAFYGCSSLTSITLPEGVTSIGESAFYGCSSLTSIIFPESVTSIGSSAFSGCSGLTSITIPDGVTSIGTFTFSGCSNLTSITIPESVTSIGQYAFYDCSGLTSITIPDGVTSIDTSTFSGCSNLTSITIPESVTSIGQYAFYGCSSLTSITIPEGVTSVGDYAFNNTAWYNNQPDGIVYVGNVLYKYKGEMPPNTSIEVKEGIVSVCIDAFRDCSNLTSIILPESVTSIGDNAFSGCSNLMEVTFKSVITPTFGNNVFGYININAVLNYPEGSDYSALRRYFSNFGRELIDGIMWIIEDDGNAYAYAHGNGALKKYPGEKVVKKIYAYDFSEIDMYAFEGSTIEELYIYGDCFERIGDYAFSACSNLTTVCLPQTLTHIGAYAFNSCESLKYIYLPEGLTYIGESAFDATGIEFLVIPESVMYIGEHHGFEDPTLWIFKNLYGRTVMESLPSEIKCLLPEGAIGYENSASWGYYTPNFSPYYILDDKAFVWGYISDGNFYSLLNSVSKIEITPDTGWADWWSWVQQLPSTVTLDVLKGGTGHPELLYTIEGSNAIFMGDNVLVAGYANSNIPYGTKSISYGAFRNCQDLESIEIPNSVSSIEREAFAGCKSLSSVEISSSVTSIAAEAFKNCVGLDSIIVDEANPVYDSRENCNAIIETRSNKLILASNSTMIPSSVSSIGKQAFSSCSNIDVAIPSAVTSFEDEAFIGTKNLYLESTIPPTIGSDVFGWGAIFVPSDAYDSYCNADRWRRYKDRIVTKEMAESEVEVWSTEGMSGVLNEVGLNEADKVVKLKVKGEINSYDIIVMRDKMPLLQEIDLSEANVVASSKPFYQTYCTGINSLGSHAFYDLDKLVSVKLPKGLTTLGDYAFYGCERLKSVDASTADELYMGRGTFESCSDLQEFVAPSVISELGIEAFQNCWKLRELAIHRMTGSVERNVFRFSGIRRLNIDSIGGHIASEAFSGCTSLKEVKVGTLVGDLGEKAFHGCSNLTSVEFARGPQKIGSNLFTRADNLEIFIVGEGASEISNSAFYAYEVVYTPGPWGGYQANEVEIDRQALKRVVLPESIQKIGSKAFRRCSSLSDFTIPQGVTSIGASAFEKCNSLKHIEIPNGITALGDKAFGDCSSLESVILPEGLTTLGGATFRGCASLTDIALPSSLTTIEPSAFSGCGALKNVTFPDGLATIGEDAFSGCGFKTLRLPPMLRMIDEDAFSGCTALEELHIPSSVEHIGGGAFSKCQRLNAVYTYTVEPTEIAETTFSTFASATLYVPSTSFWNYYWNIGWSRFNHKNFQEFNLPYDYFYLNNDYYLNGSTGYIEGTPDADLRPGSGLIVEADKDNEEGKQNLGDVNVSTDGNGNSASIIGDDNLSIENLHVKINVKGGRWYFFAFPWDVSLDRISMQNGNDHVFRYYDGDERAKNGKGGWKDVNENHLKAARGYIFQCSDDDVLLISIDDVKFKKEDKYNELITHTSENLNDASWNLMGNPYLSYYDLAAMDYTAPVTIWDGTKYVAIRPGDDDYQFAPYEAFFVQKPEGEENVGFSADAQMTQTQSATLAEQQAIARRARGIDLQRLLINLVLSFDEMEDRTRVVFNNRQSHSYEVVCDAAKFQSEGVVQIYTLDDEGVRYAINERPVGSGVVQIGYEAAEDGYYTIEATRMDAKVYLYDAEAKIMHNLENGSYTFFSGKGTFEQRFTLGIQDDEATEIKKNAADADVEVVEGGVLFDGSLPATIYDASGKIFAVQQGAGLVLLPAGTYVISIGESNIKVVVK